MIGYNLPKMVKSMIGKMNKLLPFQTIESSKGKFNFKGLDSKTKFESRIVGG